MHLLAILAIAENKQRIFEMIADFINSSYQSKTGVFTPEPKMPQNEHEESENTREQWLLQLY